MKITKRQLRRIIREECDLVANTPHDMPVEGPPEVPVPQDYDAVRELLVQNPDLVDLGIDIVMQMAGTQCERSSVQAIIDHLQGMLQGMDNFSFTGDVGELPGDEAFAVGYEAGLGGLE